MSVYGQFALKVAQDYFAGRTVKAIIIGSTYTQGVDTEATLSQITAKELTPNGAYVAGGVTVAGLAVAYDSANDRVEVTCDDVTFPLTISGTAYGVAFYVDLGSPGASRLICYDAYASPVDLTDAILIHRVSDSGILTLEV